jgi:hypothetical protein
VLSTLLALILAAAPAADSAPGSCTFIPHGGSGPQTFQTCGRVDANGQLRLNRKTQHALRFDRHGLTSLWMDGKFYYVSRSGRSAPGMAMDNWADDFAQGRARSQLNGKIGYIDRSLKLVIRRRFDGAYPFGEDGHARVCIGCTMSGGEHADFTGGRSFKIDRYGREIKGSR